jgi:mannose-6-phosphate isomerase-like protein (cupin superfamily)
VSARVIKHDAAAEYFFHEGCYINELSNDQSDPGLSVARARVQPGDTTRWHALRESTERYVILSGTGVVEVGDLPPENVSGGDVVIIPPKARQRIHNSGKDDLVFLALCTPRFHPDQYQDLE